MRTAVIDGSLDGLLSVVFVRYYDKLVPEAIVVKDTYQQRLDAEYIDIPSDPEKSRRVSEALGKLSREAAENVWYAFACPDDSRFMDIFNYILLVFSKGRDADSYLKLGYVRNVIQMRKRAGMEIHRLMQFVRFAETNSGVLYSEIGPDNDVLYMVALHFTERLISEAWVIHDVKRKKAAIYDANELVLADTGGHADIQLRPGEDRFQELWKQFLTSVAIKERINPELQRQFLPTRYRPYMTEFAQWQPASGEKAFSDAGIGADYSSLGAPTGQTPAQAPQEIHSSALIT